VFNRYSKGLVVFIFLAFFLFVSLFLVQQTQVFKQQAEGERAVNFEILPREEIKRIWPFFAQGGEEASLMLKPAENEIKQLSPQLIRIDHVFDFPDLDQRVEEIVALGAVPFLSLSYFPKFISVNPTDFPASLSDWQALVEKTIQRYSGKTEKNISGIYYEVWNEPDLFGKISPETYFSLYRSSVTAANNCTDCNLFKIGGPAITTLKPNSPWMTGFLNSVINSYLRLDFVSWHSYQKDPAKTVTEIESLKNLPLFKQLPPATEIIISEWGSVPEVSPLHDSYFDASHSVEAVSKIGDSLDKLFAFELVDGPSLKKKQFWGRWGLITNKAFGLVAKPRYYAFLYLNKLLAYRLTALSSSPDIGAIGSTDGKEAYTLIVSRGNDGDNSQPFQVKLNQPLAGKYQAKIYSLDSQHSPNEPSAVEAVYAKNSLPISFPSARNGVYLIELVRTSPALITVLGAAKLTSMVPPLAFAIKQTGGNLNSGEINFTFKNNWSQNDSAKHVLLETQDSQQNQFAAWVDRDDLGLNLHLNQTVLPIAWENESWHSLSFAFDNTKMTLTLKVDNREKQTTLSPATPITFGQILYIGGQANGENSAEGLIDNLNISLNNQIIYQKNFD